MKHLKKGIKETKSLEKQNLKDYPYVLILLALLLSIVISSIIVLATVPPVSRDALTHHLAVPKLWIKDGGIYGYPDIPFSYFPMNLDILYTVSLYFGNDIIPKFIHFSFAIFTALLIFSYLKKRLNRLYGLLGVLFFLSLPVIVKLSITVYVDLGLIFFSTASIIFFLKWIEHDFQNKHIIISAIWCGLALGTKYNGIVFFFLLSCSVPFFYLQKSPLRSSSQGLMKVQLKALGNGLLFVLVSLAVFSPWMIKNTILTGNPVYPLYKTALDTKNKTGVHSHSDHFIADHDKNFPQGYKDKTELNHFLIRKLIFKERWWETALIPARIFFQGKDNFPQYFDGRLNPFLLLLSLFAFLPKKINQGPKIKTELSFFALFSILYLLFVFLKTDMRIRYVLPIVPPLVILSMFGLRGLYLSVSQYFLKSRKIGQTTAAAITITMLSMNAVYITELFNRVDPFPYIAGAITRDDYIQQQRPEYAIYQYANRNLSADSSILGIFTGNRRYYCDKKIVFDFKLFEKSVIHSESSEKIALKLKNKGITHLIINHDIFKKWVNVHFNQNKKTLLDEFFEDRTKLIFSKGLYALYLL